MESLGTNFHISEWNMHCIWECTERARVPILSPNGDPIPKPSESFCNK